jgi:hypothetical protein
MKILKIKIKGKGKPVHPILFLPLPPSTLTPNFFLSQNEEFEILPLKIMFSKSTKNKNSSMVLALLLHSI